MRWVIGWAAPVAFAAPHGGTVCAGQLFSQAFLAQGDTHFYTPLPGGEFNSAGEGWTLSGGASVVKAIRPDGSVGGVLNLPEHASALSPPLCVTLAYPMARAWVAGGDVSVAVSYAGTASELAPESVNGLKTKHGEWTLGKFGIAPALGGAEDAPREVRFLFSRAHKGPAQVYGVYVDPRMTH